MQSSPSLQKVTAALAIELERHIYVADAARLGFSGAPPRYLDTDLGNGATLWFDELGADGTAIYRQIKGRGKRIELQVRHAAEAKTAKVSEAKPAQASPRDPLVAQLSQIVEQSQGVRDGLVAQANKAELAPLLQALKFGLTDSLRFLYRGMHAKAVLDLMAEASDRKPAERAKALRKSLLLLDSWLESWTPETTASPVLILHHSFEFEAVKDIARIVREAIEAGTNRMPPGMKVRTEICPTCQTGHSGPLCPQLSAEPTSK